MTRRFVTVALVGAMAVGVSTGAAAQANPTNSGYVLSATGAPDNNVLRSGANLCWPPGYWSPAMAIVAFDLTYVPGLPAIIEMAMPVSIPPMPGRRQRAMQCRRDGPAPCQLIERSCQWRPAQGAAGAGFLGGFGMPANKNAAVSRGVSAQTAIRRSVTCAR